MLPGFTGYSTKYESETLSYQRLGSRIANSKAQGVTLAGISGSPGCKVKCDCVLSRSKCYWVCNGQPASGVWDNGWCFTFPLHPLGMLVKFNR
jgi:hypothetical protein